MTLEFRLPTLQGSGDTQRDLEAVKRYLFQTVQQLNAAMEVLTREKETTESTGGTGNTTAIYKKVKGQLEREFLAKEQFNKFFRVGLLYQDESGQHYGVEIGRQETEADGSKKFKAAARLEPGEITIDGYTIQTGDGHLTIR